MSGLCVRECEDLIKSVQQEGDSWLDLWRSDLQNEAHVWSMQEDEESGQLDHYRIKSTVWPSLVIGDLNSRLIPVAKWLASAPYFAEK